MRANTIILLTGVSACLLTVTSLTARQPAHAAKRGTDILHWHVRKAMSNEDTNSSAVARVDLKQNAQGRANNQRVDLRAQGLEPNSSYQLWAAMDEETNFVHVADFTANDDGNARLRLMKVGSSQGRGLGRGKGAIGSEADPISHIRELAIGNVNTQMVFSAELTAPDKLQYLIKRSLRDVNGVDADLRLKATTSQVQFRFYLWGLQPTNAYHLAVNGEAVAGGESGMEGRLSFTSLPVSAGDILKVRELAVWDASSNVVISTTLP